MEIIDAATHDNVFCLIFVAVNLQAAKDLSRDTLLLDI